MQKHIELLSLDTENKFDTAYKLYETLFSQLNQDDVCFEKFSSTKSFFINLAEKIRCTDIIILAVQKSSYIETKNLLFKSLKAQTDVNADILSRLMNFSSQDLLSHSSIPVDAKPILTSSGEYCGFIHIIGEKAIIFLPLDNDISKEIDSELRQFYFLPDSEQDSPSPTTCEEEYTPDCAELKNEDDTKNENSRSSLIKASNRKKLRKEKKKAEKSDDADETALKALMSPKTAIQKMKRDNISVCVSSGKYSDFIFSILNENNEVIYPYPSIEDPHNEPSKKELAAAACKARKNCDSTLGVSISNIFCSASPQQRYYIYICIADDEKAHILKFNSKKDESTKDFLHYTALSFFSVLGHYADTGIIAVPKKRLPMIDSGKSLKKASYKNSFFLMPVISAVLCISLAFCTNIYSSTQAAMAATLKAPSSAVPVILYNYSDPPEYDDAPLTPQEQEELSQEQLQNSSESEASSTLTTGTESQSTSSASPNTHSQAPTKEETVITLPDLTVPLPTKHIPSVRKGFLQFTTYGYGHGVGMSQYGMQEMAKQGYSYTQILKHYYHSPDIKILNDPNMPSTAVYNNKKYTIKEYIGKTVRQEIGTGFKLDAIEAQVVAAYTYAKRNGFNTRTGQHAFNEDFDYRGTSIETAMNNCLGKYIDYKGKPAFCPYFSTSAGYTTCCSNVWGGIDYPYLMGGRKSPEDPGKRVYKISTDDFKGKINKYNSSVTPDKKIVLPSDPSKWIVILEHDAALNKDLGYISKLQVGNQVMSGDYFRRVIMGANVLRSHCFSLKFIEE